MPRCRAAVAFAGRAAAGRGLVDMTDKDEGAGSRWNQRKHHIDEALNFAPGVFITAERICDAVQYQHLARVLAHAFGEDAVGGRQRVAGAGIGREQNRITAHQIDDFEPSPKAGEVDTQVRANAGKPPMQNIRAVFARNEQNFSARNFKSAERHARGNTDGP